MINLEAELLEKILDTSGLLIILSGLVLILLLEQLLEHLASLHAVLGRDGTLINRLFQVKVDNVSR